MSDGYDIVIIGGGVAGLSAAMELEKFDLKVLIVEKEDRVGGRVKTDEIDGFKLDRGFQVYMDAYPEGQDLLDYGALQLKPFAHGALCFDHQSKFEITDTTRNSLALPRMAVSPIGSFVDKVKMGYLYSHLKSANMEEIFERPEHSSLDYLKQRGFSSKIIERFFQPLSAGIFHENELHTSSRLLEFFLKMIIAGNITLPAEGMEQIPRLMKRCLGRTEFRFHSEVKEIRDNEVMIDGEDNIKCDHIIVATEASHLVPQLSGNAEWQSSATYYFAADESLLNSNTIALNFTKNRLVNNFTVLSKVSKKYAPKGEHLISVSLTQLPETSVEETTRLIKNELSRSFGSKVQKWRFLKNYHIKKALPMPGSTVYEVPISESRIRDGLYMAGDHLLHGSINAAIKSGTLAAKAAVLDFDNDK